MKRGRKRSFSIEKLIVTHPDDDHGIDAMFTRPDGSIVLAQAKPGTEKSALLAQAAARGRFYRGDCPESAPGVSIEGEVDNQLFEYLLVDAPFARTQVLGPPRLADFLMSLIPLKHRANLPGDLEEDYWNRFLPRHGLKKARFLFWAHVVYSILGFLVRPLAGIAGLGWIRKFVEQIIHLIIK
jgi:hypothetical protein